MTGASGPGRRGAGAFTGVRRRLRPNLPWILLILCSITFAEFLTGSTPVLEPIVDPVSALFLVGLYGGGVLLVREAAVRWRKGWPTILLLGMAYGIVEEGIGTKTFFGPAGVGELAVFGHFAGVNWVWAVELTLFHASFSIGLPILVVGLMFPATEGRSFLASRRAVAFTLFSFLATVAAMFYLFNPTETPSFVLLLGTVTLVGGLLLLARRAPRSLAFVGGGSSDRSGSHLHPAARGILFVWGFFGLAWIAPAVVAVPAIVGVALAGWTLGFGIDIARHRDQYADPVARLDFAFGALTLLLADGAVHTFFGDPGAVVAVAGTVYALLRVRGRLTRSGAAELPRPAPSAAQPP
jgi:hypothetical protein